MIESTYKNVPEQKTFPRLRIRKDTGRIILFINDKDGTIVKLGTTDLPQDLGYQGTGWIYGTYEDLPFGAAVELVQK